MDSDFINEVRTAFSSLTVEHGYKERSHFVGDSFDNGLVELSGRGIDLRVTRERGQVFVEVRSPEDPATWFDLDAILRLLNADAESRYEVASGNASLESLASIANRYLRDIEAIFDKRRYGEAKTRLATIMDKRAEERWGPL